MKHTNKEIDRAIKKLQIIRDKTVDLQDMGFGNDAIAQIQEAAWHLENELEAERTH